MTTARRTTNTLAIIWLLMPATVSLSQEAVRPSTDENLRFFESRVRPILVKRCYECHGEQSQEGELRLDGYASLMQGGASGPVVVPGKPEESLLIAAIGYQNEELRMPPEEKLPVAEANVLREWVLRGVPHPEASGVTLPRRATIDLEQGRQFWSFQSPVAGPLPEVGDTNWSRSPVDRFLLADLESQGLHPSPDAEKLLWMRRITFSLTGLPPTPEEIDTFFSDGSPTARDQVIERLLSSHRYGERWGRYWLDVVRYADSNGSDENVAHGNAWRYRDYVIGTFNDDKPFDEFVREQLAGDLLPAGTDEDRHEKLIATGFLSLGAKVLAEVDARKMEMDIVDEQIDTFGRAFLGLTLGCSRCHDHKFDPIRTDDYYALAGIFQSTRTMENFKKVARWHENAIATPQELAAKAAYDRDLAEKKNMLERTISAATQALGQSAEGSAPSTVAGAKAGEQQFPASVQAELKKLRDELKQMEKSPPPLSTAMGATEGTMVDSAICLRGSHLTLGRVVPRGAPALLAPHPLQIAANQSGRLELAQWLTDRRNPLLARVFVNRVWRWHFGRGIVESTENFGMLGEKPTNQRLLDWLAVWFMDHGWSVKELQRLIVRSAGYGQSSDLDRQSGAGASSPALIDPDNRRLWRFPMWRLEAEAIRDAWLFVSDQLDSSRGGSLLHVGNREYLFDHTSKDNTKYDSRKRTVYLPVIRNNLYDLCQLFDATDATLPSGDRATSTVATQSLFVLNSSLVHDAAGALAEIAYTAKDQDRDRLRWLWLKCLGRPAEDREVERAIRFLSQYPAGEGALERHAGRKSPAAWIALCQALLGSNEFIYVR